MEKNVLQKWMFLQCVGMLEAFSVRLTKINSHVFFPAMGKVLIIISTGCCENKGRLRELNVAKLDLDFCRENCREIFLFARILWKLFFDFQRKGLNKCFSRWSVYYANETLSSCHFLFIFFIISFVSFSFFSFFEKFNRHTQHIVDRRRSLRKKDIIKTFLVVRDSLRVAWLIPFALQVENCWCFALKDVLEGRHHHLSHSRKREREKTSQQRDRASSWV